MAGHRITNYVEYKLHYSPIAVGLVEMNGDLDSFNKKMTTGYKVIDGYNLQMESMSNQIELAKNNFKAFNGVIFEGVKGGLLPFIKTFNTLSESSMGLNKTIPILSSSFASIMTYFGILAGSSAIKNIANFALTLGSMHPVIRGVSIALAGLVGVFSFFDKLKMDKLEKISLISEEMSKRNKISENIQGLDLQIKNLNIQVANMFNEYNQSALDKQNEAWQRYAQAVGASNDSMKELLVSLKEISNYDPTKGIKESDIINKKITTLKSGRESSMDLQNSFSKNIPTGFWNNIVSPLSVAETELVKSFYDENLKVLKSTHVLEEKYPEVFKKLIEKSKGQIGGVTGKGFGEVLGTILSENLASSEYLNYEKAKTTVITYDEKIKQKKLELNQAITQEDLKQIEIAKEAQSLAKDDLMKLDIKKLKLINNFNEYKDFLSKTTGIELKDYISKDILDKISKSEKFDVNDLKSASIQSGIISIKSYKEAIKSEEDTISKLKSEMSAKDITGKLMLSDDEINRKKKLIEEWGKTIGLQKSAIKGLLTDISLELTNGLDKVEEKLVDIDFKTIKSNIEELTNELASMGINGLDLVSFKMSNLIKNYNSNFLEIQTQMDKLGIDSSKKYDYQKTMSDIEAKGSIGRSEEDKKKYEDAYNALVLINQQEELGLKYSIDKVKLQKDYDSELLNEVNLKASMKEQLNIIKNIGKEKTLQSDLDDIRLEKNALTRKYNFSDMTDEEYKYELLKLETKEEQAKYEWRKKEYENSSNLNSLQREMSVYGYSEISNKEKIGEIVQNYQMGYITKSEMIYQKEKLITDEKKKQIDATKQQLSSMVDIIDKMSKGEFSMSPSYDLSKVIGKISNKGTLTGSDYGQIFNFALTETSNVWATINKQQAENINHQIDMLEMQKQLAKTDEERQAIERQILDKKIQAINLELQTQQQQAVMGGITQGTSAILASPTNPLAWLVGGLDLLSGIFGANQAEKQAKRQKDALILQQRIAEATELTNKYMQINNKRIGELYAGQSQGYEYALNKFYSQIKSDYSSMSGAETISSDIISAFKKSTNKSGLIKDTGNTWNTIFGQGTVSLNEGYGGASLPKLNESNVTSYISSLESEVKSLNLNSDFTSVLDKINALSSLWGDYSKTGADANKLISAMDKATQSWKNYINALQNLSSKKDVFYSAYFGFKVEEIEDTAGNITDVIRGEWEKRKDIMDKIVENAKTGANDIASYLGDYTIESILNSWTRNQSSLTNVITKIENDMYDLGTFMSKNVNKSFTSLADFSIYTNTASSSKRPVYEEYNPIKNLVLDYQALSAQQDIINQQASNFLNIWVEAGGEISDITSYMSDFSKNLYTAMQSALSQNTFIDRFNTIGESLSNSITDKLKQNLMDNSLKNTFLNLNSEITKIMSGQETSISDVLTLRQQIEKATVQMTAESEKVRSISDLLNMSNDIQYSNTNQQIQYTSGTTSQITNNYANNITLDVSTLVTTSKEDRTAFANAFAGEILTAIEKKIGKIK